MNALLIICDENSIDFLDFLPSSSLPPFITNSSRSITTLKKRAERASLMMMMCVKCNSWIMLISFHSPSSTPSSHTYFNMSESLSTKWYVLMWSLCKRVKCFFLRHLFTSKILLYSVGFDIHLWRKKKKISRSRILESKEEDEREIVML